MTPAQQNQTKLTNPEQVPFLCSQAMLVRKIMLDMFNGYGCLSGAFSVVELYVALYLGHWSARKTASGNARRLRVLPKGTSTLAFYATLHAAGLIEAEQLKHYGTAKLPCLLHAGTAGSDATLYTLGPTLGTAVGIALASKLKRTPYSVICFMGDGELQEHVDQAAKCAAGWGLDNLSIVVDCNRQQSYYPIEYGDPTMMEGPSGQLDLVRQFWQSCGWHVVEIDGHDFPAILEAYHRMGTTEAPYLILARTLKGKGVPVMEGKLGYQHKISPQELEEARHLYAARAGSIAAAPPIKRKRSVRRHHPKLAIPERNTEQASLGQTFASWIQAFKDTNPGVVYTLDSDCPNIFHISQEAVLTRGRYTASHLFPGLNERLTLTVAKGLAHEGMYPIIGARANNLCNVGEEWHGIGIDHLPVLLTGTRPGAVLADWGPEKCSFFDIEILARPGIQAFQPSNPRDLVWILEKLYSDPARNLPAYVRIPDFTSPKELPAKTREQRWIDGYDVCHGTALTKDFIAIIASGDMLHDVLRMVQCDDVGYRIKILDLFNLTRVNPLALQANLQGASLILSVIEARSRSISELIFTALTSAQKSVYEPLGIENALPLLDLAQVKERGYYAARAHVLAKAGLDALALRRRLDNLRMAGTSTNSRRR